MRAPRTQIPSLSETDLLRSILKESFYDFVVEMWPEVIVDAPVWNWHIKYLCDELQVLAEAVFRGDSCPYDLIVNVPPGSTKSTICSQMFPAWVWTRMPEAKHICASYSHDLALMHSRKTRAIVSSARYQKLFPLAMSEDQDTKAYYENDKKGFRYSVGSGGSVTGVHGHFIIVDDPINVKQSGSEADRLAINQWMTETLSTRKVDKARTPTILIMQRLHEDDPTGDMLSRCTGTDGVLKGVKHICLPAEDSELVNPPELRAKYKDGLLDPVRISRATLDKQRVALGEFGYAGQFEQRPAPREGALFKRDAVVLEEHVPPLSDFTYLIRYWDKAATKGAGCYSVGTLMGRHKNKRYWVLDVVRGQWSPERREEMMLHTATLDGKSIRIGIEQEPGSGGKESAEATVRNLAGYIVDIDRPTGDKITRAYPFAAQVNAGNVSIPKNAAWARAWLNEFQFFPASKLKDQVDSGSAAFAKCSEERKKVGGLW